MQKKYYDIVSHVPNLQLFARSSSLFFCAFFPLLWSTFFIDHPISEIQLVCDLSSYRDARTHLKKRKEKTNDQANKQTNNQTRNRFVPRQSVQVDEKQE